VLPPYLSSTPTGILLRLHVQPRAKRTALAGAHGDAMKLRVAAPPVDGAANHAVLAFVAKILGVPLRAVTLRSGDTSRQKFVEVDGVTIEEAARKLGKGE
jgi:uncharacterized protein (TIGR00251 family)